MTPSSKTSKANKYVHKATKSCINHITVKQSIQTASTIIEFNKTTVYYENTADVCYHSSTQFNCWKLLQLYVSLCFINFYRAVHRIVRYWYGKSSVRNPVMLRYPDHIGWKSSKIISQLVTLGRLVSADPNISDLLQGKHPGNFGLNSGGVL